MLHTIIAKRLGICIEINIEISEVDHYTWVFTSRIFKLVLEIIFLLNKYFFLQMAYELLSQYRKLNKEGRRSGGGNKVFPMSEGNTCIAKPNLDVLLCFRKGLVFKK